jgi:hypothetical protein
MNESRMIKLMMMIASGLCLLALSGAGLALA